MKSFSLNLFFIVLLAAFIFAPGGLNAQSRRGDMFLRPQAGIWFGPITPLFDVNDRVDTYLGGGCFGRINTGWDALKLGADISIQNYKSYGLDELSLIPLYGSFLYRLPIRLPINFQLKAGAGVCRVAIEPEGKTGNDPMFMGGFEVSFPAGRIVNMGLRVDYMMIYEKHIQGAKYNAHVLNTGLTLYFNI